MTSTQTPPEALYIEWRRWLEEDCLHFGRRLGTPAHQCWAHSPPSIVQPSNTEPFYGCTECGRTHVCRPPFRSCPRLTPLHSPHTICPFSGRTLETADDSMVPGTFKEEGRLQSARGDVFRMNKGGAFVPYRHDLPDELENRASNTSNPALRQQLFRQADEVRSHLSARRDIRELDRQAAASSDDEKSSGDEKDPGNDFEAAGFSPLDLAPVDEDGDEKDAPSRFTAEGTTVLLPPENSLEVAYDARYLEAYLDPVLCYIENHAQDFAVKRAARPDPVPDVPLMLCAGSTRRPLADSSTESSSAGPPAKRRRKGEKAPTVYPGESYLFIMYQPPQLPWRRVTLANFSRIPTLLEHQRLILVSVRGFIHDVTARSLAAAVPLPAPLPAEEYALRVDRALMLFNWRCEPGDRVNVRDRKEQQQVVRAVVLLLSAVFSGDFCAADPRGTVLPVWLADPFLEAAERANLLGTPFPFAANETASSISRTRAQVFLDTLRRLEFSPQRLGALINDHGSADPDNTDADRDRDQYA